MAEDRFAIPAMHPQLPRAQQILAYLEQIDRNRWYSNHGPLVRRLEERLGAHFDVDPQGVACVANGTLGLVLTLMLAEAPRGALCLMPSWTFAATPHAAIFAGLEPYFLDVDPDLWCLTPAIAQHALDRLGGRVGAVLPVSVFGAPVDLAAWDAFSARSGVPVVVDAAGAFDSLVPGASPSVVSLHACKILGCGEGGVVVSREPRVGPLVRRLANFGFGASREAERPALNAKLSEYDAAVCHAALDDWPAARESYHRVRRLYRRELAELSGELDFAPPADREWMSSRLHVRFKKPMARFVQQQLAAAGIHCERWWGDGCHRQPAFRGCARAESMPATEAIVESVLCLPTFPDLQPDAVRTVASALRAAIASFR